MLKNRLQKYSLFIAVLYALILLTGETAWLQVTEGKGITKADQKQCQRVVEGFCRAWMNGEYEVMYRALSKFGMGRIDKKKFVNTYRAYRVKGGRLNKYSIKRAAKKEDFALVKADLKFANEIPPKIVTGVHSFHMVREQEGWKIKYVMPPVTPPGLSPLPGGSHPGE